MTLHRVAPLPGHELGAGYLTHLEKLYRSSDIDLVVVQRPLTRFTHRLERSKVDDSPNPSLPFVLAKHRVEGFGIGQVGLVEMRVGDLIATIVSTTPSCWRRVVLLT